VRGIWSREKRKPHTAVEAIAMEWHGGLEGDQVERAWICDFTSVYLFTWLFLVVESTKVIATYLEGEKSF